MNGISLFRALVAFSVLNIVLVTSCAAFLALVGDHADVEFGVAFTGAVAEVAIVLSTLSPALKAWMRRN